MTDSRLIVNKAGRERIRVLERRMGHLRERLECYSGGNDSWTRAELDALSWAVQILRALSLEPDS